MRKRSVWKGGYGAGIAGKRGHIWPAPNEKRFETNDKLRPGFRAGQTAGTTGGLVLQRGRARFAAVIETEGIDVRISNLMLGASVSALVLSGLAVAQPAWAQSTDAPADAKAKDGATADDSDDPTIVVTARRKALQTAIELKRH